MSVTNQTPVNAFTANGVTTVFNFTFQVLLSSDLLVQVDGTTKTLSADYSVSGVGNPAGGSVTFTTAPANGAKVILTRNSVLERPIDYQNNGDLRAATVNQDFDRLWLAMQEITYKYKLAPTLAPGSPLAGTINLPEGAGKFLRWNLAGTKLESVDGTGTAPGDFLQSGPGAVARSLQSKIGERVSVLDFGADNTGATDCFMAVANAWAYCLENGIDLYLPGGIYKTTAYSFPFGRIDGMPPTSLLNCKNITVYGDGPATILRTDSVSGADVIQINGAKNLHLRNFKVTGTISGTDAGSNGISITGGFDNVTIENVWAENLPSLDKTAYIDGGKALTIQTPAAGQTLACGTLKARNIFAKGCVYGFGLELDLVAASSMDTAIDVEIVAEDCRDAVIFSAGAATGALPANWNSGLRVKAQAINCMRDVVIGRGHGVDIDCQVITTKTKSQRILNYAGVKWFATDAESDVGGLTCTYAANSRIRIYGNKGDCGFKAQVGGAAAGSSGYSGATEYSDIVVDLSGTSTAGDFGEINSGGNITRYCRLVAAGDTAAPSTGHYAPSLNNAIVIGNTQTLKDLYVQGKIVFPYTDGYTGYAEINYDDECVTVKQSIGSSAGVRIQKFLNHAGATVAAFRNDGALATDGRGTATAVATVKGILPIYDAANNFWGYVPVYTSYTP